MCGTDIKQQPSLPSRNPSASCAFPVSIGNLVASSIPGPTIPSWILFSLSLYFLFSDFLRIFLMHHLCYYNSSNNSLKAQNYYIFHNMKIQSMIVHYAKNPPKQMHVIISVITSAYERLFISTLFSSRARARARVCVCVCVRVRTCVRACVRACLRLCKEW